MMSADQLFKRTPGEMVFWELVEQGVNVGEARKMARKVDEEHGIVVDGKCKSPSGVCDQTTCFDACAWEGT